MHEISPALFSVEVHDQIRGTASSMSSSSSGK
jgi:hypothetical protein